MECIVPISNFHDSLKISLIVASAPWINPETSRTTMSFQRWAEKVVAGFVIP